MKRKRISLVLCVATLLVLSAYSITSFSRDTVRHATIVAPSGSFFDRSVRLDWPARGSAAIGSIEDGLLASSGDERSHPTASMAKVIVALAVMKKQPIKPGEDGPTYVVTVDDVANYRAWSARGGSVVPVYAGMAITQYEAMEAMLLPSGNNIADLLVDRVFGSMNAYTSYAEDMLKDMDLTKTTITDASGFSPSTQSTPSEMVVIGIAALKNPVIAEIVAKQEAVLQGAGVVTNTNELLGDDGVIGIKTGTTDDAGNCLLFAARLATDAGKEVTVVGVIMGDSNAKNLYSDSRKLLASARRGYSPTASQSADSVGKQQHRPFPPPNSMHSGN